MPVPVHAATSILGIDLCIKRFATFSDGTYLEPMHRLKLALKELAKAQRALARKKKFSANWQAQKIIIQNLHRRIKNIWANFLHQASHQDANHGVRVA